MPPAARDDGATPGPSPDPGSQTRTPETHDLRTLLMTAAAASLLAGAAHAAFDRAQIAGSEVYRTVRIGDQVRTEKLMLHRDGRLSGAWVTSALIRDDEHEDAGVIAGRWSVERGRLCLSGSGLPQAGKACMDLAKHGFSPLEYAGSDANGDRWQVFIHPRPGISSAERR